MTDSSQIIFSVGDSLPPPPASGTVSFSVNPTTGLFNIQRSEGDNYDFVSADHNHDDRYYLKAQVDSLLTTKKDNFSENTAFNKNFGLGHTDVARGDHTHEWSLEELNGVFVTFAKDPAREKILSVDTCQFTWAENSVSNHEWMKIGRATDADTGYIMPNPGTIIGVTAFCENGNNASQVFRLYIGNIQVSSSFFQFPAGNGNVSYVSTTENIDFNRGDRIRLRAGNNGSIYDTNISIFVKWRKA